MPGGQRRRKPAAKKTALRGRQDAEAAAEKRAERLSDLHDMLTEGVERISSGEGWKQMLNLSAKLPAYSFRNLILLLQQKEDITAVAGFKQWKTLGRTVKRGEHALYVLAPLPYKVEQQNDKGEVETAVQIRGFKPVPVFDISQTDGPDIPLPSRLTGEAPAAIWDGLVGVLQGEGYSVSVVDIPGRAKGDTSIDHKVRIDEKLPPMEKLAVLFHEGSHILHGHIEDIDQYRTHRGKFEVEAESTAYVAMTALGLDVGDWSFEYVAGWADGDQELLQKTADKVVKTAKGLLDTLAPDRDLEAVEERFGTEREQVGDVIEIELPELPS